MFRLFADGWRRLLVPMAASCAALLPGQFGTADQGSQASRPPNIVVILVDDLGHADIGRRIDYSAESPPHFARDGGPHPIHQSHLADGHFESGDFGITDSRSGSFAYTPHLDRLFEQGIGLTQYLTHTLCSPTRAGLLTGQHYTRVGSGPETGGTLHIDASNLASDLQIAGYATAAFGKWHNGYPNFPADGNGEIVRRRDLTDPENDQFENYKGIPWGSGVNAYGFDEWQGFYGGATDYFDRYSSWHNDIDWWTDDRYTPSVSGHTVDIVSSTAVDFIRRHQAEPFFCYVPMPAPHTPLHILRSDLETLSSQFAGAWQRVRSLTSPTTGRRIDEVEELRCGPGEEFDHTAIDPDGQDFFLLVRATLIYAMDRAVGDILTAIEGLGLSEETVVWFLSDNGGNTIESSYPLRGKKGSLYEGGIRVPAAVWWPGTLDSISAAYSDSNIYPYLLQYLDVYPTTMSMAGLSTSGTELDGRDGLRALLDRAPINPLEETTFISFNREMAVARGGRWKLLYNESGSQQRIELFNIETDPLEKVDLIKKHPEIVQDLVEDLHRFMDDRRLSMSYFPPREDWISSARPQPDGDVLEVFASQTRRIEDGDLEGLFVRFASAGIDSYGPDQLESGDLLSYDLLVAGDSERADGFFVTPSRQAAPVFDSKRGVTADGALIADTPWPRRRWVRVTIGIGEIAPSPQSLDFIALRSPYRGNYHFFLDNVKVLRSDGSTKAVIWASKDDSLRLRYRYRGVWHENWESVSAINGFQFSDVSIEAR